MKNPDETAILRVVIATGISSIVTQLYTIREFLTLFAGNEYVIALIIFSWLVLGGAGTLLSKAVSRSAKAASIPVLGWLSLVLAAVPTAQIVMIRLLRDVFFIPGTSVGFYATLAYTFFAIAPYAVLIGFVLPYSLFVLRGEAPGYPGARIYIIDSIGDVTGGALFSFALVHLLTPIAALCAVNVVLLASAVALLARHRGMRPGVCLCAALVFAANGVGILMERWSLSQGQGNLVHYEETFFGRLVVFEDNGQFTLMEDGVPLFSSANQVMAEEAVHYGLSQRGSFGEVLVVSSVAGMMEELEKYRPASVDYVELDPAISRIGLGFGLLTKIPALHIIHADGRAYLQQSEKTYDAIIMNLPEPETFQVNRFYTKEFFSLARARLKPSGVLSFSVEGYDNYLAEPQRQKISSLYNTVAREFGHILMLPGQRVTFLCSDGPLSAGIPALLEKLGISTGYIGSYFSGNVTPQRIAYLRQAVDETTPVNADLSPTMMRIMFAQWFAMHASSPLVFLAFVAAAAVVYLAFITREEFVLFSTGATIMGAEILIIFIFQILFGYVYLKVGMIVTVFLAGLLPGALLGQRLQRRGSTVLVLSDAGLLVLLTLLVLLLKEGGQGLPQGLFYAVAFGVSLLCGFQFPVALLLRGGASSAVAGLFSADLMGAALGTLVMSIALIPYLGVWWAAAGLIVLKLASIMVQGVSHGKDQQAGVSLL